MPIEEKSVGMQDAGKGREVRYCVECGARVLKSQKVCPACGEGQ